MFGGSESVAETLDDTHGQYHVAVFVRLVGTNEFVGYSPDEVGLLLNIDGSSFCEFFSVHIGVISRQFNDCDAQLQKRTGINKLNYINNTIMTFKLLLILYVYL